MYLSPSIRTFWLCSSMLVSFDGVPGAWDDTDKAGIEGGFEKPGRYRRFYVRHRYWKNLREEKHG